MSTTYAVTGATGGLGGRVAQRLADRGVAQRLVVRDPARAPELPGAAAVQATYEDGESLRRALDGVDAVFLVSASEAEDRRRIHFSAVDAAVAAGVGRIVYTSFLNAAPQATFTFARDHWHTEERIKAAGVPYTFLRDSLYLDYFPFLAGADGVIRGPAGSGRASGVARGDIADVATAVLLGDGHDGRTYDLTGPEAISFEEAAEVLSRASGRTVTYHDETVEEAYASRASYGAPDWEVAGWVSTYQAVANGELATLSDDVERIVGHPPVDLAEYLRRHPESCDHLRA